MRYVPCVIGSYTLGLCIARATKLNNLRVTSHGYSPITLICLVLSYLKATNRSVDNAVKMAPHFSFQHLEPYSSILLMDFSSPLKAINLALLEDQLS